jgi:hypothetical protein
MNDLEEFREIWLKYDPQGTFICPSHHLMSILQQLKAPIGLKGVQPPMCRKEMLNFLGKLDIPDRGGYVHFVEVLTAITHGVAGVDVPVCDMTEKLLRQAESAAKIKKGDIKKTQIGEGQTANALTNYLVSLLQSRWRGYEMRQQYEKGAPGKAS